MTSIFKDIKPPFGTYYISGTSINSIITIFDTKVVYESVYKNKYTKTEITNLVSSKDKGLNGTYSFAEPVIIGSVKLYLTILYAPGSGYEQPAIFVKYHDSLTGEEALFNSVKGVNLNPPPGFISPTPQTLPPSTPSTKSFFDKYFIYIVVFILLMIMSLAGGYFFIKNKKSTISK